MLILPDGYKKWSDFHDKITPGRHDGRKLPKETGMGASLGSEANKQVAERLRYVLPNTFCPDCNSTAIVPNQGQAQNIHVCAEQDGHLELKPTDIIVYFVCSTCIEGELWGKKNLVIPGGKYRQQGLHANRQIRREANCFAFLRSLHPDDRDNTNVRSHAAVR